jgi:ABC-type uncharacterized transport system permease subunit
MFGRIVLLGSFLMGLVDSNRVLRGRPVYVPSYSSEMIPYVTKYNVPIYVYSNDTQVIPESSHSDSFYSKLQ